ncbi:MAG: tRNA (guanosine(46)-N7)-methyltransferase TrmB [Candidatus Kapaibacteriales bacterium]
MSAHVYFPFDERNPRPQFYPPVIEEINWSDIFENGKGPNSLDIGCGMGRFLLDFADENRSKNVLGLEVRREPVDYIKTVIAGENLGNCTAIRYSLANGLPFINSESVEDIFYFFPDPWYKTRQQKRRVFSNSFLDECYRVLKKDAKLYIQTDVEELHKYHIETLEAWEGRFSDIKISFKSKDGQWELHETDQEKIALRADFEIHRIILTK